MITPVCQRWRDHRSSYRPAGEPIQTRRYEVEAMGDDGEARRFVEQHHYSGSYPAARRRFGLWRGVTLVGVAVFSVPISPAVITSALDLVDWREAVELGRLVLLDDVPANGESWFIAQCFRALRREGFAGVVSFSDPLPRRDASGRAVFRGHVGTIYQASNARYVGQATPRTLRLLPTGEVFSSRAAQKIRARDRGCRYAAEQLAAAGADPLTDDEDARAWLRRWLPAVTRTVRHPGNHKYAWSFGRRKPFAAPAQPYPKRIAA